MIKTIVNKFVKTALNELFTNARNIKLSMGADMFSDSNLNFNNLILRADIFDVYLQPLRLVYGNLGKLVVEGIAELALGGRLKFQAEDINLLFHVDMVSDTETIQLLKKIQLELLSGRFISVILKDLLQKIQGFTIDKEPDIMKKRKVIYKMMDYLTKGIHAQFKNIHIRIEFPQSNLFVIQSSTDPKLYAAVGLIFPLIRFVPNTNVRPDGLSKNDPHLSLTMKSAQIYCDYDRDPYYPYQNEGYTLTPTDESNIFKQFTERNRTELHTSIIPPTNLELIIGIEVKRLHGLLIPIFQLKIPSIKFLFDSKQIEMIENLTTRIVFAIKRMKQLVQVKKIFRKGFPLPRVYEVGGMRFLPHLAIRGKLYPSEVGLARNSPSRLVKFMQERVGTRWPLMLWKHVTRLIIHDMRLVHPIGKWLQLARLASIRKDYAFNYRKLLKYSKETGEFVYDSSVLLPAEKQRDLFEYEMMLSNEAIIIFRSLAQMIATVEMFNAKRRNAFHNRSSQPAVNIQPFEKVNIEWSDILRIHTELYEAQRETKFHRFDRPSSDEGDESYYLDLDDGATSRNSVDETGSVYSYSLHLRTNVTPAPTALTAGMKSISKSLNINQSTATPRVSPSASKLTMFSPPSLGGGNATATGSKPSLKAVTTMGSSTMKLFSSVGGVFETSKNNQLDEYDSKLLKKFDLSVFGDALTSLLYDNSDSHSTETVNQQPTSENVSLLEMSKQRIPGALPPTILSVAESVQWAMTRHQEVVTVMPPDISIQIDTADIEFRGALMYRERKKILTATLNNISFNVTVSQSAQTSPLHQNEKSLPATGSTGNLQKSFDMLSNAIRTEKPSEAAMKAPALRSFHGMASLAGALIQIRLVVRGAVTVIYLDTPDEGVSSLEITTDAEFQAFREKMFSGKGTTLTTGLPSYHAETNKPVTKSEVSIGRGSISQSGIATNEGKHVPKSVSDEAALDDYNALLRSSIIRNELDDEDEDDDDDSEKLVGLQNAPIFAPAETTENGTKPPKLKASTSTSVTKGTGLTVMESYHLRQSASEEDSSTQPPHSGNSEVDPETLSETSSIRSKGNSIVSSAGKVLSTMTSSLTSNAMYSTNPNPKTASTTSSTPPSPSSKPVPMTNVSPNRPSSLRKVVSTDFASKRSPLEKEILVSKVNDQVLIICLIFDFDEKNEGATDVQIHLGSIKLDLGQSSLRYLMNPTLLELIQRTKESLEEARKVQSLLSADMLIIDRDQKMSIVSLMNVETTSRSMVKSSVSKMKSTMGPVPTTTSSISISQDDEDARGGNAFHISSGDSFAYPEPKPSNYSSSPHHDELRRKAIVANRNAQQWLGILEGALPRVLSMCIRTSQIRIDGLESSIIREMIYNRVYALLNRAVMRNRTDHSSIVLDSWTGLLSTLLIGSKNGGTEFTSGWTRKWGSKLTGLDRSYDRYIRKKNILDPIKSSIDIPGLDFSVAKASIPYPAINVKFQGMEIKIPMSDETLCHFASLLLAEYVPIIY